MWGNHKTVKQKECPHKPLGPKSWMKDNWLTSINSIWKRETIQLKTSETETQLQLKEVTLNPQLYWPSEGIKKEENERRNLRERESYGCPWLKSLELHWAERKGCTLTRSGHAVSICNIDPQAAASLKITQREFHQGLNSIIKRELTVA